MKDYPIIPALPSYGRGRELPGARHSSLINSEGLEDVVITGSNLIIERIFITEADDPDVIFQQADSLNLAFFVTINRFSPTMMFIAHLAGDNGTIDGQGAVWWSAFRNKTLDYTRGHLVELIDSKDILISNLTFRDSPFWTIHPVYCRYG